MDPSRLRGISLFKELPEDELQRIAKLATETSVAEGEHLVHQGDFAYELFGIEEGSVEVQRDGQTLARLKQGDVFGETAVVQKEMRNADVIAVEPTRLVVISRWDVRRMRKNLPDLDERLQRIMEQRR